MCVYYKYISVIPTTIKLFIRCKKITAFSDTKLAIAVWPRARCSQSRLASEEVGATGFRWRLVQRSSLELQDLFRSEACEFDPRVCIFN